MKVQKIYTALLTADLAVAEYWYTKLFGRGPDNRNSPTSTHLTDLSGRRKDGVHHETSGRQI